jgi:hypothetical protein
VWEVRVVVGNDPLTGRSVQCSFTVHGSEADVAERRRELVAMFGVARSALYCSAASWTLVELLERFIAADHGWKPATHSSHASVVRFLAGDAIGGVHVSALGPRSVEGHMGRWRAEGASEATVFARWSVLHSALSWATRQELPREHPMRGTRKPKRPEPRTHLLPGEIAALVRATQLPSRRRRRVSRLTRRVAGVVGSCSWRSRTGCWCASWPTHARGAASSRPYGCRISPDGS